MRREEERIREAGARIAFIGSGTPEEAKAFAGSCGEMPVFSDVKRAGYAAVGFKRSWMRTLSPRVGWHFIKSSIRGYWTRGVKGDPIQQGGIVLVAPPGRMLYRYEARHAADHPPLEEILNALRS